MVKKQKKFIAAYVRSMNARASAMEAGYKEHQAQNAAQRLLADRLFREEIERQIQEANEKNLVNREFVVTELARVAGFDPAKMFDANGALLDMGAWPQGASKAIASFDVQELYSGSGAKKEQIGTIKKVRVWDKLKALELLGKTLMMFREDDPQQGTNQPPRLISEKSLTDEEWETKYGKPSG